MNIYRQLMQPLLTIILSFSLLACDKSTEQTDASENQTGKSPISEKANRRLAQADKGEPLSSYRAMESGNQLMFLYYALSEIPIDYNAAAEAYSVEYRKTEDSFRRNDILKALKPRIEDEVSNAKKARYFVYKLSGDILFDDSLLHHYDFESKAFPVSSKKLSPETIWFLGDNRDFKIEYTNTEEFRKISVEDEASARHIETLVNDYDAHRGLRLAIYGFAQDADPNTQRVKTQIVRLVLLDGKGNVLAEQK